jgi:hypothetical protein
MSSKTQDTFGTSDLATAAYLKLKGLILVDCSLEGKKFRFVFEDPEGVARSLELEFANSECHRYDNEIKSLKKLLYSESVR